MKVFCAHTKMEKIEKLVSNPKNPNTHSEKQIELLAKIIDAQGWRNPITVSNRSGFVIKGHGRLLAAQLLNYDEVPVDYQEYENEAAEWADMIADNKIAELSELDDLFLKNLLRELDANSDIDLELTAFSKDELAKYLHDPIFQPVSQESQPRLDELSTAILCPHCGKEFIP